MLSRLSKKNKISFFLFLLVLVVIFLVVFDKECTTQYHELGHRLACSILGIQVTYVGPSSTGFVRTFDWREPIVNFMGGFVGSAYSFLVYVFFSLLFRRLKSLNVWVSTILFSVWLTFTSVFIADSMMHLTGAILETAFNPFYKEISSSYLSFLVLAVSFSVVGLLIQLRRPIIGFEIEKRGKSCVGALMLAALLH
jgi:hypothetical protein